MVNNQSQKLAQQIWAIANKLRGNMDASKFKDYILGVIFYRYLSARTESYMDDLLKNDGLTYREALKEEEIAEEIKGWALDHLGYVIEPDYLFDTLVENIRTGEFTIEKFERAISKLTESTIGQESEHAFENLFDAMDLRDADLGKEVSDRTKLISTIILKINDTPFAKDSDSGDVLGTAYMILIGLFQSGAGKKGGEFFTPTCVSTLLAQLTTIGLDEVRNVSDGCAGSGSLLLEVRRHLSTHKVGHFYAQEKTGTTYNLLRMNLIMHGVPYKNFTVFNDDTLTHDNFYENGEPVLFDIQVENPPYSAPNTASDASFKDDPRYKSAGVLAPKGKADLAFVEGMVYHMAQNGRIAVLLPHGVLFRGDAELEIRKYLIDNLNCIDAVIGLPANCFHGTGIPVVALYLKKNRNGNSDNVLFIDAAKYYEKVGKNNALRASDIKRIVDCVRDRKDIPKFSRKVSLNEIRENDYNMNIPRYVDSAQETELWDLYSLMFGGVPAAELDRLGDLFNAFPGLRDELFEKKGKSYALKVPSVKEAVLANAGISEYISAYRENIENMEEFLCDQLLTKINDIELQAEEGILTDELFTRLSDTPLIDKYEAYQLLNSEWLKASSDIEIIHSEGFQCVKTVEPNMVMKKKDGEDFEIQDGMKGHVLPFELVQRIMMPVDVADLREKEEELASIEAEISEMLDTFSDEEKDYETGGVAIVDKDKNAFVPKAISAAMKQYKKEYGKMLDFDEDTVEYKVVTVSALLDKEKAVKATVKKAKEELDEKTITVIENLSDEEAKNLLKEKWIIPFINSISGLADTVITGYINSVNALVKKYETTYEEEDAEISDIESSLAEMLGSIKGSEEDNLGTAEWIRFLGGN